MSNFDFDDFENQLKKATKEIFVSINSNNNVCGFSLFSDSDAGSISAAFNTKEYLKTNWKKYPEDKEYYRWYPAEWFEEGIPNDELDNLSLKLFNTMMGDSENQCLKRKYKVFQSIVNVLKKLKDEGLFNSTADDFVLVFYVTDSDEDIQNELKWIKELNKEVLFKKYEKWVQTWDV